MAASRTGVRRAASASAAGAGHDSADTAAGRSRSRCRTRGVATPTATAPHASVRRARVLRKAAPAYLDQAAKKRVTTYRQAEARSTTSDPTQVGSPMSSHGPSGTAVVHATKATADRK